jgi:hypothetical protein
MFGLHGWVIDQMHFPRTNFVSSYDNDEYTVNFLCLRGKVEGGRPVCYELHEKETLIPLDVIEVINKLISKNMAFIDEIDMSLKNTKKTVLNSMIQVRTNWKTKFAEGNTVKKFTLPKQFIRLLALGE